MTKPSARSLLNLMPPWKPGTSGNPRGRPRGRSVSERYAHFLELPAREHTRRKMGLREGATLGDVVAIRQVQQAMKGNTNAAREIREAIEGKAPQRIELTSGDGGPVDLTIGVDQSVEKLSQLTKRLRARLAERRRKA